MNGDTLLERSAAFERKLNALKKQEAVEFQWYPYGSLNNFVALREIFNKYPLDLLLDKHARTLDIGAADGDISFFLESLGYSVTIVDNGPTNYNGLRGARVLKERPHSNAEIHEIDLDTQFKLPQRRYDMIFFLGILYHLKNPFYILEALSYMTTYMAVSTRVAQFTTDRTNISGAAVAYLLGPTESNNDYTNYWIFSDAGLRRILDRTGWDIVEITNFGDTDASNPSDPDHDERAFVFVRSRNG